MSLFTKKAYVGLDIGHHTLRAVQVERTPGGWRVAKYASVATPEDTVRDGVVIDEPLLGLAIKNLLKNAHIHATSAAIAISGGTVVVRPIRLPKMAESALRKSIRFEASRYVPNSVEDSYIEFEIIGDVDATNMDVVIAAAPRELVDSRVSACEHAGLEVEHVEVATFAAYRSIIEADHGHDWAEKTVGLVDIGAAVTNLGVVSNGAFSMTRAIPAGGQVLTDALKSYFKLSTEDAENGKSQLDIRGLLNEASVAENPPLRILHSHVDDLVREVRRSINYWQSQQNEASVPKHVDVIVLCGGGANMPGLSDYFKHKLGIDTLALGVFDNVRFSAAEHDAGHGLDLAVAVGLAMGLAPAQAVIRDSKPAAVKEPNTGNPTKPPKAPKPDKPAKGRTFKVSRPVDAPPTEDLVEPSREGVEVAAAMPSLVPETQEPELSPRVAEAPTEESVAELRNELEESIPSISAVEVEEPAPIAAQAPTVEVGVEEKYGPELAALIGAFESDPPVVETRSNAVPPPSQDDDVQTLSASQRMASRGNAPKVQESNDHEAMQPESLNAPTQADEPVASTPLVAESPVAPAMPSHDAMAVRSALLGDPVDFDAGVAPVATQSKEQKKSLFSIGRRPAVDSMSDGADAKDLFMVKRGSEPHEAAGQPTAPKERKSLFPGGSKPAPVARDEDEAATASALKKAASWFFGTPKQHVKPSGVLAPKGAAPSNAATTASRDAQIELLRGSTLEPVETKLVEAAPAAPAAPPEPKITADAGAVKAKSGKAPAAKKPRTANSAPDSKKEAA